jgi:hypothetical protein
MKKSQYLLFLISFYLLMASCSSVKYIRKEGLPTYETQRTFESSFSKVWSAAYNAVASIADIEIAEESDGIIKTDWTYGESDVDIARYKINDQVKYKKLKLRFRYTILLKKVTGGTHVTIHSEQEYEELGKDFEIPTNTWVATKSSTIREYNLLENIKTQLLRQ